jgi:hypothetical protein
MPDRKKWETALLYNVDEKIISLETKPTRPVEITIKNNR